MTKRIKKISPLQLGKLFAVMYALFSIVFVPFILVGTLFSHGGWDPDIGFFIFMVLGYIVMGFIGGIIGGFVYNLSAKWVGGIELEFEED